MSSMEREMARMNLTVGIVYDPLLTSKKKEREREEEKTRSAREKNGLLFLYLPFLRAYTVL